MPGGTAPFSDKKHTFSSLKNKSKKELIELILSQNEVYVPAGVFSTELSPLTSLVKYLHENKGLPNKEISLRLGRHEQTIWTTYRQGKGKQFDFVEGYNLLPLSIFSKERLSILETLVSYLKDDSRMSLTEISGLLNKNVKTIWTCYKRFMIKGGIK